jgi:hypothetical protein
MDFDDLEAAEEELHPSPKTPSVSVPAVDEAAEIVVSGKPQSVEDVLSRVAVQSYTDNTGEYEYAQTNTGWVKVRKAANLGKAISSKEGVLAKREELDFGINLPPQAGNANQFFDHLEQGKYKHASADNVSEETKSLMDKLLGGGQHSYSSRRIEIVSEDGTQCLTIGAFTSTTVREVKDLISAVVEIHPGSIRLAAKKGAYWKQLSDSNQCASKVKVSGTSKLTRQPFKHKRPIVIMGAGYGGISSMLRLLKSGRDNFVCIEKLHDFGGRSWIVVANKHTKLQTEKGTYHVKYMFREEGLPHYMPTWPSRDQVLDMFRRESRYYGLEAHTVFNTEVRRVPDPSYWKDLGRKVDPCAFLEDRVYDIEYGPVAGGESKVIQGGMVLGWPGNLSYPRVVTIPGEDSFEGYIEYGSGGNADYERVEDKNTILYGHGAFMIENVRTVIEYGAKKVFVVCRRKNLTAPKMISWLISQTNAPGTGALLMDAFSPMYALAGLDPWLYHSVTKNQERTYARIDQTTVFGVTDVYFLAQYYGKAQLIESMIKRLGPTHAHLQNMEKIPCEALLKVLGIVPDPWVDKVMCIDHVLGIFVNSDPLRIVMSNGMHVSAQNFGTFSVGPGIVLGGAPQPERLSQRSQKCNS